MYEYGDIVVVIGSESIPESFLGSYGMITDYVTDYKCVVEFKRSIDSIGSLSHTAKLSDLKKIASI
jgi:hypothetical protein